MTVAAPALPASPAAGSQDGRHHSVDDATYRLYGLVRDVRVEAQHLGRLLEPARGAVKQAGAATQAAELAAALDEVHRVFATSAREVNRRIRDLRELLDEYPVLYNEAGDSVSELENQWREIEHALTWTTRPDVAGAVPRLAVVDVHLPLLEWQAAIITVPVRVLEHLATKRVGGRVNFHEAFKDEVEDRGLRVELLRYLREHSAGLGCVVDVPNGLLYRVSPSFRRRAASWVAVIGLATVGGYAFVWLITHGVPAIELSFAAVKGLGPERFAELMGAYWALLIGAIAHVVVEALKQDQRSDTGAFVALEDWFIWVHVREAPLIVTVLSLYVILVGLATLMPDAGSIVFVTALGAGYSFDSVLGLFVTRFEGSAKAAAEVVTETLKTPVKAA